MESIISFLIENKEWIFSGVAIAVPIAIISWLAKRMSDSKQIQRGGDQSVNIQAECVTLQTGLTVEDVRNIALDVFKQNFYQLVGVAEETATQRAEEITDKFLEELQKRNPEGIECAEDPDFQYALFTAQKEYVRAGDSEIADILVDILVDRSKREIRSLESIVLNESLNTVPKLTSDQIAALSLIFNLRYTKYLPMVSLEELRSYISHHLKPFIPLLPQKESAYMHLEFAGCCNIQVMSFSILDMFRRNYPGLFSKGFKEEALREILGSVEFPHGLILPCLHNKDLLQFNEIDEKVFEKIAEERNINKETISKLLGLHNQNLMNESEIREHLESLDPVMAELIQIWKDSRLKQITLTSVGIAIGHANLRRITKDDSPLSIWI